MFEAAFICLQQYLLICRNVCFYLSERLLICSNILLILHNVLFFLHHYIFVYIYIYLFAPIYICLQLSPVYQLLHSEVELTILCQVRLGLCQFWVNSMATYCGTTYNFMTKLVWETIIWLVLAYPDAKI